MKKTTLKIKGMHCPSCNILVQDKFKTIKNIKQVKANFKTQTVDIHYKGSLDIRKLNQMIVPYGYSIMNNLDGENEENKKNNWLSFLVILVIFITIYSFLKKINLLPEVSYKNLSLPMVFLLGVIASVSTCMATTGVLYLTIAKENNQWWTALSFSLGRVIAYGFFGFIFGFIGKQLINSVVFSGILSLIIALTLIILGLDLVKIISWSKFTFINTSRIFEFLRERLNHYPRRLPFFLGGITYFLPCGFTQSVQIYSMGLANPSLSALNMIIFAIGTVPLILIINQATKIRHHIFYQLFLRIIGVLIFLIGINYFFNFLSLFGFKSFNQLLLSFSKERVNLAQLIEGKQEIKMTVDFSGYRPSYFEVKKGVPVRWVVEGKNVLGCQGYFVVPKLGISKALNEGENIFEFTPQQEDLIGFSCGMGMYRGYIKVKN